MTGRKDLPLPERGSLALLFTAFYLIPDQGSFLIILIIDGLLQHVLQLPQGVSFELTGRRCRLGGILFSQVEIFVRVI
jgi:hypothetical protein